MSAFIGRDLGCRPFSDVWEEMKRFTDERTADTPDEIWFVEHPSVFTLGLNADPAHILDAGDIPVIKTDRGGQVTYHGPGQLVVYTLLDLSRRKLSVRATVETLESVVIETVARYGVNAYGRRDAPGVYVDGRKLAAVGLRIRRSCSYHGISVNVSLDLSPYERINPCGFENLEVAKLGDLSEVSEVSRVRTDLEKTLAAHFPPV